MRGSLSPTRERLNRARPDIAAQTLLAAHTDDVILDRFNRRGQSSFRFDPLRPRFVDVPLRKGPPKRVYLRPRDRADLQTGIEVGFETNQLNQSQMAVRREGRLTHVWGGSNRKHEDIIAPGIILHNIAGHTVAETAALDATSRGRNPLIEIPGSHIDHLNLHGYNGRLRTGAQVNNPDLSGAAITMEGPGTLLTHGAKTGGLVIDKTPFAALLYATDWAHDPTEERSSLTMPSTRKMHSIAFGTKASTASTIQAHLQLMRSSTSAAAIDAFHGHEKPRSYRKRELEAQFPTPQYS